MDILYTYLPPGPGLLPKWLLFVSLTAIFNTVQSYSTLALTRRVYSQRPQDVTPLSSRTFGTWTFFSAIVRLYAAYNISNQQVYQICLWSYIVAAVHFVSEWLVFGTAGLGAGLSGPLVVSSSSIVWMLSQREYYLAGGGA